MKIKDLKNLPARNWDDAKAYRSVVAIPSGKKHDSGWALMAIIGLDDWNTPIEIAAYCDDICWKIPYINEDNFRTDMFYPTGAIHFWSRDYNFLVGPSLSSTDITLIKRS